MHIKENSFTLIVDKNDYNMYYKMHAHLRCARFRMFRSFINRLTRICLRVSSVLSLMAINGKRAAVNAKSCQFLVKIINNAKSGSMACLATSAI